MTDAPVLGALDGVRIVDLTQMLAGPFCTMSIGELIHCDLKNYPNVQRWLGNVKKQPNYEKVNEVFNGFRASTQGKTWATV